MNKNIMKKLAVLFSCVTVTSLLFTGCGKKGAASDEANTTTTEQSKDGMIVLYGSEEEYGKATLCDYSNLEADKYIYEITDQLINEQMQNSVNENIEYKEVDRAIQEDDSVDMLLSISCDGEVLYDFTQATDDEEAGYEMTVGYEEFGDAFDQKIKGAKKGDHLSFSLTYEDDFEIEEFAGKTIDYDLTISSVTEEEIPELTDDYIKNTLGFDSKDAFYEATKQDLTDQYAELSISDLKAELLGILMAESTFEEYSPEMLATYKSNIEATYASYMEMFGASTLEEIYSMFEITPEDIEDEALQMAQEMTVMNQIGREQNICISQDEYNQMVDAYVEDYDYETKDEFLADYTEAEIKTWILEEKVYDYLIAHAKINEVPTDAAPTDDELYEDDENLDDDAWTEEGDEEAILLGDDEEDDEDFTFEVEEATDDEDLAVETEDDTEDSAE